MQDLGERGSGMKRRCPADVTEVGSRGAVAYPAAKEDTTLSNGQFTPVRRNPGFWSPDQLHHAPLDVNVCSETKKQIGFSFYAADAHFWTAYRSKKDVEARCTNALRRLHTASLSAAEPLKELEKSQDDLDRATERLKISEEAIEDAEGEEVYDSGELQRAETTVREVEGELIDAEGVLGEQGRLEQRSHLVLAVETARVNLDAAKSTYNRLKAQHDEASLLIGALSASEGSLAADEYHRALEAHSKARTAAAPLMEKIQKETHRVETLQVILAGVQSNVRSAWQAREFARSIAESVITFIGTATAERSAPDSAHGEQSSFWPLDGDGEKDEGQSQRKKQRADIEGDGEKDEGQSQRKKQRTDIEGDGEKDEGQSQRKKQRTDIEGDGDLKERASAEAGLPATSSMSSSAVVYPPNGHVRI